MWLACPVYSPVDDYGGCSEKGAAQLDEGWIMFFILLSLLGWEWTSFGGGGGTTW